MINNVTMAQLKIFINDKLYKTVTLDSDNYEPSSYWPQINADKQAGLLNTFNIEESMKVEFRKS
jgi:hypothetical protein